MHPCRRRLALAFAVFVLAAPALAQRPDTGTSPPPPGPTAPQASPPQAGPSRNPDAADRDMMASMEKMAQDMTDVPMTGDPDRDFAAMMIPHHQGAIDMARVELRYGKDPTLLRLSHKIVAAQTREITQMQRWQLRHHPSQ
ncbi:CopM family metallochaperone [Rhodopila sp.]|uniref:CopM family metallochaperone n=1 Tax=Rhodopila sp. TaxID=2480087 RepID=UPI003D14D59C